jgi:hypothetical protein
MSADQQNQFVQVRNSSKSSKKDSKQSDSVQESPNNPARPFTVDQLRIAPKSEVILNSQPNVGDQQILSSANKVLVQDENVEMSEISNLQDSADLQDDGRDPAARDENQ